MYLIDVHTKTPVWVVINLVGGIGTGMLFPSMVFAIQASASDETQSFAIAMSAFIRAWGQAFGVAIGGVAFQNALRNELGKFPALSGVAAEYSRDAVALVQVIKSLPHGGERDALIQSYAKALKPVWLTMMAFGIVGLLLSLATEELDLNRGLKTEHGMREKKKKVVDEDVGDVKA